MFWAHGPSCATTAASVSRADGSRSLGAVTLGSGQSSLRVAAVQPHRTWQHTWLVRPSLPGPQLSPVSRALSLLESTYFLGEAGCSVVSTTRGGRPGL